MTFNEERSIIRKIPYTGMNDHYIQPIASGKNKDLNLYDFTQGRWGDDNDNTKSYYTVFQETTKDFQSKEGINQGQKTQKMTYTPEYRLMSDFDDNDNDNDIVYAVPQCIQGTNGSSPYNHNKILYSVDVPNHMIPLNVGMDEESLNDNCGKVIKLVSN